MILKRLHITLFIANTEANIDFQSPTAFKATNANPTSPSNNAPVNSTLSDAGSKDLILSSLSIFVYMRNTARIAIVGAIKLFQSATCVANKYNAPPSAATTNTEESIAPTVPALYSPLPIANIIPEKAAIIRPMVIIEDLISLPFFSISIDKSNISPIMTETPIIAAITAP